MLLSKHRDTRQESVMGRVEVWPPVFLCELDFTSLAPKNLAFQLWISSKGFSGSENCLRHSPNTQLARIFYDGCAT